MGLVVRWSLHLVRCPEHSSGLELRVAEVSQALASRIFGVRAEQPLEDSKSFW